MTLLEKLEFIERIDCLIRRKATGPPKQLADRLDISERCLFKTLSLMKEMGAPIYYGISFESYAYEYDVEFSVGFKLRKSHLAQVIGGVKNFFLTDLNVQYARLN